MKSIDIRIFDRTHLVSLHAVCAFGCGPQLGKLSDLRGTEVRSQEIHLENRDLQLNKVPIIST
ncbi:MAG: hypothetical protein F6K24_06475 [Okeania sp. SIO2D1]|nr:hypothetical protein [Okeania sp. SIO2D1]